MGSETRGLSVYLSTALNLRYVSLALVVVVLALLPVFLSNYAMRIAISVLLYIYLAQSWNIAVGFSGAFSFFQPVLIGTGAYTSTLLYMNAGITPWLGMLVGGVLAVVVAIPVSYISIRARLPKLSFALFTLAADYIVIYFADGQESLGGHDQGLVVPPKLGLENFQFESNGAYYYVLLCMVIIVMLASWRLLRSRLGLCFRSIADNERAAEAVGVDIAKYSLVAIAISAFFSALGGTFYAQFAGSIMPATAFAIDVVISVILFLAVGGIGTLWGPVLGVSLLVPIGEFLRFSLPQSPMLNLMIYGLVVIVVLSLTPQGIMGLLRRKHSIQVDDIVLPPAVPVGAEARGR